MKTTEIKHKTSGKVFKAEIYTSFVYLVDEVRKITLDDFKDFFVEVPETIASKLSKKSTHDCVLFKNNSIAAIGLRAAFYNYYSNVHDCINMRASYVSDFNNVLEFCKSKNA